jgi:serine/threonine-protein kinase
MLVGTPHYAQPEQIDTPTLTPAADVYSLAMVLYELLSARTPFDAERTIAEMIELNRKSPVSWLRCHAKDPVISLRAHLPAEVVSDDLCEVVSLGLAKPPGHRPQDAAAFAEMLRAVWPR